MPTISPQITYVNKSDKRATRGFYSEERSGFVRVNDLVYDFIQLSVTDIGVMSLKSFKLIESLKTNAAVLSTAVNNYSSGVTITSNVTVGLNDNNTAERVRSIVSAGSGYAVGAVVTHKIANTTSNLEMRVSSVDSTGRVLDFEVINAGSYYTNAGATTASASKTTTYSSFSISPVLNTEYTDTLTVNVLAPYNGTGATGFGTLSGLNCSYTGAFAAKKIFVGQEVVLAPTANVSSEIPAGTTVANIKVVNSSEVSFEFSASVKVNDSDGIYFRGAGLTIKDNEYKIPERFTAILESNGRINPLASDALITGTLVSTIASSTLVNLSSVSGGVGGVPPVIYAGQLININGTSSTILSANVNIVTNTANLVVSSAMSASAGAIANVQFDTLNLQPWRLGFDVRDSQTLNVYAATNVQLQDNGNIARITDFTGNVIDHSGIMGNLPSSQTVVGGKITDVKINTGNVDQGFVNRSVRVGSYPEAYPMNYAVTFTNRGVFFGIWEGSWSAIHKSTSKFAGNNDSFFNWFLIQRPVDRLTGRVLTTGRAPVFCINSVGYKYWKFIVRERDVMHPTQGDPEQSHYKLDANSKPYLSSTAFRVPADQHTDDSFAILNTTNQIALSEDSKYLISFLHNLTTPRFRYSEELDMLGQTSADVCMAGNDVLITAYQESGQRAYKALPANKPYNTGLRICVLRDVS